MANHQFENSAQYAEHNLTEITKNIELFTDYLQACSKPFYSAESHFLLSLSLPLLNLLHGAENIYRLGKAVINTVKELFNESTRFKLDIIMDGLVGILFNIINICLNLVNTVASLLTFFCRTFATLFNGGYAENQTSRAILSANSIFGLAKSIFLLPKNLASADTIKQLDDSLFIKSATFLN